MPYVEDYKYTDAYDLYISALAMIPKAGGFSRALVTILKRDFDRNIMGYRHPNPLLDTCVY